MFRSRFLKVPTTILTALAIACGPLVAASAGAATGTLTCVSLTTCSSYQPTEIGEAFNGTLELVGTGFADNGSTVTITSSAAGVTFTNATESSATTASATMNVPASTAPGWYSLTLSDGENQNLTLANAFYINPAPTVTSVTPSTLVNDASTTVTLTGTNFEASPTLVLTSTVDGTKLAVANVTDVSATSITANVTAENNVTSAPATPGTYNVEVVNSDGGVGVGAAALSVSSAPVNPTVTATAPSELTVPNTGSTTTTVALTGTDFETGATVTVSGVTGVTAASTLVTSPTTASVQLTVPSGTATGELSLIVTNPDASTSTTPGAVGINEPSSLVGNAPTVTAVSSLPALTPTSTGTLTVTGTNFSPSSSVVIYAGSSGTAASGVTCATTYNSSTQLSCAITSVSTSAQAGPDALAVLAGDGITNPSADFANAVSVAGPVITSGSPSSLSYGAAATLTLTGTGFASGDVPTVTGATYTANSIDVVSSTDVTLEISNAVGPTVNVTLTGPTSVSPTASVATVAGNPTVTGLSYVNGVTDVAVNAHGTVTITGTGFLPGATVTFVGSTGITASVTTVSPTSITATVTTSSSTPVGTYPFTVANTNAGFTTTTTIKLSVAAAPTLTALSPNSVQASSSHVLTVTGSGFVPGATVQVISSNSLVVLGTTTYVSSSEVTVPATFTALSGPSAVNVTLAVVNPDGGSASGTVAVNTSPTVTGTYTVAPSVTNLELTVNGTGFSTTGVTATSNNPAYQVTVVSSTATSVLLLVTTTAAATTGTSATITLTTSDASTVAFTLSGVTPVVTTTTTTTTTPPPTTTTPPVLTLGFAARSAKVTSTEATTLATLAKKLTARDEVRVTGYAPTIALAQARARVVAARLKTDAAKDGVTLSVTCAGARGAQGRVRVRTTVR